MVNPAKQRSRARSADLPIEDDHWTLIASDVLVCPGCTMRFDELSGEDFLDLLDSDGFLDLYRCNYCGHVFFHFVDPRR